MTWMSWFARFVSAAMGSLDYGGYPPPEWPPK